MGDLQKRVGRRIKRFRKAAGLTQQQLADRTRGNGKYIGYIEQGRKNVTLNTLDRICRALHVQPYLLFTEGPPSGAAPTLLRDPALRESLKDADPKARALALDLLDDILRWSAERKKT
jgi:transcriptional regulator with XRE-family HTH domain